MDISDERRKKLEAGKEKLAAFRKKKAKSKKTAKDNGENLVPKDVEPFNGDANSPSVEDCIQQTENNDDIYNQAIGDEPFSEVEESTKASFQSARQQHCPIQVIPDSENGMKENLALSETVIGETKYIVNTENSDTNSNNCGMDMESFGFNEGGPDSETLDIHQALAHRDKLIGQLTHSLKSNADQQQEKEELISQVLTLAQQVTQLQTQLKEADQTLQEQFQLHGISGSALQSAKSQMLQLQSIVHEKDRQLFLASQQLEKNHESLCRIKEENVLLSQRLNEKEGDLNNLQQCYDATISSHEEKQEKEESEKSYQLSELQRQWKEREDNFIASLESQAKEIEGWRKYDQDRLQKESELQQKYENLVNQLQQAESGNGVKLKALEHELIELRQQNEKMVEEADVSKRENEQKDFSLSKLEHLAEEHAQLTSLHSKMVDDFQLLKSKNIALEESLQQLNIENEALRSELGGLSSMLAGEHEKLRLSSENQAELESKHFSDCDKLNNKINQLQSNLSLTQESCAALELTLSKENETVEKLKQELATKESSHNNTFQELASVMSRKSELQSEVQCKEDRVKELEALLKEREEVFRNKGIGIEEDKINLEMSVQNLTEELKEFKNECANYIEQISVLQSEKLSHEDKVDILKKELETKGESLDEESERCTRLEDQLQIVEEERSILNENIKALNNEIYALKEDLQKKRLQADVIGEELISVNAKLVDCHNVMQHSGDEHKGLVGQFQTDIDKLQSEVNKITDLDSKLLSSMEDMDKLNRELKETSESLQTKSRDFEELKSVTDSLREGERQSASKIECLEEELSIFKQKYKDVADREQESIQNLEELQRQLETTVSQWQKLQLIVQEKEIELQNLNDDLDEQKRICNSMKRSHEEYLDSVQSDAHALKNEKESKEFRIIELEDLLTGLRETLAAKDIELSDTITRVEAVGTSSDNLAMHLSEKEKELDLLICDKEKINAELSDRMHDIKDLKQTLRKAEDEVTHLSSEVETAKTELSAAETKMESEREENEALVNGLESKVKELLDKELDSASQVCRLETELTDVQKFSNEINAENNNLKVMISDLENACARKTDLLSQETMNSKELEKLLGKEKQFCNRLRGELSSMSQDSESKEELLLVKSASLEAKIAEILQGEQALVKASEEIDSLHEHLERAKEEIKMNESTLGLVSGDKESLIEKLQQKDRDLDQMTKDREKLNSTVENLKDKLIEIESKAESLAEEANQFQLQIADLQTSLCDKDQLLSQQEEKVETLIKELNAERQQSMSLKSAISSLSSDVQDREEGFMQQGVLLEEKMERLLSLETEIGERDVAIREVEEKNAQHVARIIELTSKETRLENEIRVLREQLDKHEQDLIELSVMNKELHEYQTQSEKEIKNHEGDILNMKRDNQIIEKECCDLRIDLQEKENKNVNLLQEVESLKSTIDTNNEEKEVLKSNFDACLEEMQQKLSEQEIEMGRLKSRIAEESRNRDQGQEEMREMYIQQLAQMEDKLLEFEREKSKVEKEVADRDSKLGRLKYDYDQQVSDMEISLNVAQSEVTKMKDTISKISVDHDNELTDLKSLHELQMSELMENYLTLEKSMTDVQKNLADQAESMKQERNEMEQSFENLMSEMDEKKRRSDSDINRLKKQQDEIIKDHENEMRALEKKYETQLFDLEDRCSVLSSELERVRKSVVGVEGDFAEERIYLESKIDDLENIRRDLEIKTTILEDDISLMKEQSNKREDEVKSILKTAAEKQSVMKYEMEDLEEKLRALKLAKESSSETMKKEFESRIEDINAENDHLKNRLKSFEMNAELDMEMKGHEDEEKGGESSISKLEEMKKQVAALSDENLSLKRRLLGHKSLEKKVRMLSTGMEDIRPPLKEPNEEELILPSQMMMVTSTPSKKDYENDIPFSPTAEEVSLIEGFVSETNAKTVSAQRYEKITPQQSADEEPDFVVEEEDRFQPEMVIEKAVDDFGDGKFKRNVHPIQDIEVTEGFQPELADQFFVEISEESHTEWPLELSVGLSPTTKHAPQGDGFFDERDGIEENFAETNSKLLNSEINFMPEQVIKTCHGNEEKINADDLIEKRLKQMKEDLEEDYAYKLRKQKQDIILEYEMKNEQIEKEYEQRYTQKEQSVKHDWEIKFAKAVKKMKKDFEKKLQKQSAKQKGKASKSESTNADQGQTTSKQDQSDEMSDIERSEGLGDVVEQLSKENQELAEVRDELLKQIEISQARGRHNRVQHELQSMLSEREKESSVVSQDNSMSSEKDDVVEPEIVQAETPSLCSSGPIVSISVDAHTASSQITEPAERSPTVAAERILEELEDISQQSSQDLPLEWELTNTIPVETGISLGNTTQHQSVWEVFGSRCERQDCLEVRNRYRRLCQCVVSSFGIGEELISDESGLVQSGVLNNCGDEDRENGAINTLMGFTKSDDNNPDDEEEVDELFADNVTLESELLSLAENMVLYKDAFMNKKTELEKENEFLRLELETESKCRKDEEVKFNHDREVMKNCIGDLEHRLAVMETNYDEMVTKCSDETSSEYSDKGVMTDPVNIYDIDTIELEIKEKTDILLKEKEETIQSLQLEVEFTKAQFEEEIKEYKENTESKIKSFEEEILDLKTENNYLCLTHEGKEETIMRLLSEIDQYVTEKDGMNETISESESKLLDVGSKVISLAEDKEHLQGALIDKEKQILNLDEELSKMKLDLEKTSKNLASVETELVVKERENGTLREEKKNLESALHAKEDEIDNQNSDVKTLAVQLEDSVKNSSVIINTLESKVTDLKDETSKLRSELQEKNNMAANLDFEVKQLKSSNECKDTLISDKDKRIEVLENELLDMEEKNVSLQSVCRDCTKMAKNLELETAGIMNTLESKVTTLVDENSRLHSEFQENEATCSNLSLEVIKLKSINESKDIIISDKDKRIEVLGNELSDMEEKNTNLQSVCSNCTKMVKSLELEATEINANLAVLKQENDRLHMRLESKELCQSSSADSLKVLEDQLSSLQDDNSSLLSDVAREKESVLKSELEIDSLNVQLEDLKQENIMLIANAEETQRFFEEKVLSLQEDNKKLQAIVEAKQKNLSESEVQIDDLGSELHDLSTRLDNLKRENDELKVLEGEVCNLKDQNEILLENQKEKQDIITQLNEDIDNLKAQLSEFEKKVEEYNAQNENFKSTPTDLNIESHSAKESCKFVNSCPAQTDIMLEDEIIPVKSNTSEQQPTLFKETDSDVTSAASSQVIISRDTVDSVTSPLCISISSIPADQESMVSSISVDQSSGVVSPAELQDQALAEELTQLKKDLRETKAIYSRENSLLHEALEREKRVKDFVMGKNEVESSPNTESCEGENQNRKRPDTFNPDTDMEQKLAVCLEQNRMLEEENSKLRTKIRKQEAVVLIYKHRLSEKEHDSELWRKSLTGQLQALQKQRDDLVQLLRNQEMGLSSSCPTISEAIGQAALKEESLRRVQDDLMEKMEELDHLHQMLTQRQVELQHCDMERRHLEQLCVLKDQTEMQLMKQKRLMEEQVCEIEHRLKERETMLSEEKSKLLEELKEKDDRLLQMSQPQSPRSPLAVSSPNRSFSMGDLSSSVGVTSFGVDLNSSAEEADQHHLKAIETLREKLRLEYSVRSSRLAESQASAVASYWMRRQSSKDGSQNFDA